MSPTGPNYAGTAADTGTAYNGASAEVWSNPSNATGAQDGSAASVSYPTAADASNGLKLTNFGFSVPSTAVIDGILVEHYAYGVNAGLIAASLVKAGTIVTASQKGGVSGAVDNWGSSGSWQSVGGATDLWNNTALLPADVNDSGFGVVLYSYNTHGGGSADVDSVRITVYWHTAPTAVPKRYLYKVYDGQTGNYLGNLPNVISDFGYSQDINTGGGQIQVDCGSSIDTNGTPLAAPNPLLAWYNSSWGYRNKITVPAGTVASDLTNYPLYVDLSDLPNEFWNYVNSDGSDIRVTSKYGTSQLPIDLVGIDTSAKTGELWIRVPTLSAGTDNVFYLYYGNSGASAPSASSTYGSQNVWNSTFKGVYHLNESANTTSGGYKDRTANANNGTGVSMSLAAVAGKIGVAAAFNGTSDYISIGSTFGLGTTNVTLSAWVYIASTSQHGVFVRVGSYATNGFGFGIGASDADTNGDNLILLYASSRWIPTATPLSIGWHLIHMTIDGAGVPSAYLDGSLINSYAGTNAVAPTTGSSIAADISSRLFAGDVDEVHIVNGPLSSAWIAAEYANQNSPSTFYTVANREILDNGSGAIVKNGNLLKVIEFGYWNPNGKQVFSGQIQHWEGDFGGEGDDKVSVLAYSDGNDMDNHLVRGSPFTYTADQSQATQNASGTISADRIGSSFYGQTAVTGAGVTNLGAISLYLKGTAHVTIQIYTDATLSSFLGSVTQYVNVASATEVQFGLANHLQRTAGDSFFFRVLVNAGESIIIYYSTSNPYASGIMYSSAWAGAGDGYVPVAESADDLYFKTFSSNGSTTATFTSQEPVAGILEPILGDYAAEGGAVGYTSDTMDVTTLSVTYQFNTNSVYEGLLAVLSIVPSGYYFYVDMGTNLLYFKQASLVADVVLTKGYHINRVKVVATIEQLINTVYFTGGLVSSSNLYLLKSSSSSVSKYKQKLDRPVNNLVTDSGTAGTIAQAEVDEMKDEQYGTVVQVLDHTMDITTLRPGLVVGFNGFGSFVDGLLAQIVRVDYAPECATLTLGILPKRLHTAVEQVVRGVTGLSTVDNPSAPS